MKYIKTYEKITDFEVDDFILLNNEYLTVSPIGKIVDIIKKYGNYFFYKIQTFDGQDEFFIERDKITRRLTPEEVKDFLMKNNAKKYNI